MIKNIIFDMGNVLIDFDPEVPLKEFCREGEERDTVRRELFESDEWWMADRGDISDKDRYELIAPRVAPEYQEALKNCCFHWYICMKNLVPGAKEFVAWAKENYKIYVLSNASDLFYDYFLNFSPLEYFDGIVVSADLLMLKPDARIYEYLLNKYQLDPKECLFIDDRITNVEGARAVGINAVQFTNNYDEIKSMLMKGDV